MTHNDDDHKWVTTKRKEPIFFTVILFIFQIFMIICFAALTGYDTNKNYTGSENPDEFKGGEVQERVNNFYGYFRDINIMIFFGFGFLMTFLRRYGYSALGYTFIISALVSQWSVLLNGFFEAWSHSNKHGEFPSTWEFSMDSLLQGFFCSGSVMISYGAILGRVTPLHMLIMGIIEPIFFFLNVFIGEMNLEAIDVGGGMYIHLFGSVFGLTVAWFLTDRKSKECTDNAPSYSGDNFAMAGTLFLWMMWPSFNAAIAPLGEPQFRAIANTFLSLTGSTVATFIVSRLFSHLGNKLDMVHVQNSSLAGGVVQGCIAHMNINPGGAIAMGFIAGTISVCGYLFITPKVQRKLHIQDTCGILNLHCIPGFLGSIAAIFAAIKGLNNPNMYSKVEFEQIFRAGDSQASANLIATMVSIGLGIVGGLLVGFILLQLKKIKGLKSKEYYQDSAFWILPIDYPKDVATVVALNNAAATSEDTAGGDDEEEGVGKEHGAVEMGQHNRIVQPKQDNKYHKQLPSDDEDDDEFKQEPI
ncbi:hypothetical protein ACTFIZ_012586 [Dictyostelium cf. discoideum]